MVVVIYCGCDGVGVAADADADAVVVIIAIVNIQVLSASHRAARSKCPVFRFLSSLVWCVLVF